jgi:hypothetical protein
MLGHLEEKLGVMLGHLEVKLNVMLGHLEVKLNVTMGCWTSHCATEVSLDI